jgi:tetratricopeptide (TPR) repeat protein
LIYLIIVISQPKRSNTEILRYNNDGFEHNLQSRELIMHKALLLAITITLATNLSVFADQAEILPPGKEYTVLDFDTLWDYEKPAETRARFNGLLAKADKQANLSYYLQLQTQIARTYGLQQMFDSAHQLLDEIESQLADRLELVKVRYLLERGRTINSSGSPEIAIPLFTEAFELAGSLGTDFYAIDAAHMVAIAADNRNERMKWNRKGLEIAEETSDQRARGWLGSIYNNIGWDYHEHGEYDQALAMFEKALAARVESGKVKPIRIARWCVARAYRSLGRVDEALEIQLALEEKGRESGDEDGFVWEELGELYLLKKDKEQATEYFAKAYDALSKVDWLAHDQPDRLARLKKLGKAGE